MENKFKIHSIGMVDDRTGKGFVIQVESEFGIVYHHNHVFETEDAGYVLIQKILEKGTIDYRYWDAIRAIYLSDAYFQHVENELIMNDMDENYKISAFAS